MTTLTDDDRQFLNENYWSLVFVDDVQNVRCGRCNRVALNHRLANCNHIFCFNCIIKISDTENCKCHKCGNVITLTAASDNEVEIQIRNLKAHCTNYKHGCQLITNLYQIPEHLKVCQNSKNIEYLELHFSIRKIEDDLIQLKREIKNEFQQQSDFLNKITESINEISKKIETINKQIFNLKTYFEDRMATILQEILEKVVQQTKDIKAFAIETCKQKSPNLEERKSKTEKLKVFNVVLLGEKGCGKSSFANSLSSCISFKTFSQARGNNIATSAKLKNRETSNANAKCKNYNILVKENCSLRIFESAGLRYDLGGKNKNLTTLKYVFNYMQSVKEIHSVAFVLKTNERPFIQHLFEGIRQITANFHRSSAQNVVFIFTHFKDQNKVKIIQSLRELLANYSLHIKINEENIFFFENEEFANLFNDEEEINGEIKWQKYASEATRFVDFVFRLPAHDIEDTLSVINHQVLFRDIGMMIGNVSQSIQEKKANFGTIVSDEDHVIKLNQEKKILVQASGAIKQFLNSNSIVENSCISTPISDEHDGIQSIMKKLVMMDTYGKRFRTILQIEKHFRKKIKRFSIYDNNNNFYITEKPIERVFGKKKSKRCLNILFLGETGKGKSTLINAFANYSRYSSFAEACHGPEVCPIPTQFIFTDEDYNEMIIQAGSSEDPNESMSIGKLGTQYCKSYQFSINDKFDIRLIDSSGFASSKGPDQDAENVRDIVSYVEQFEEIHAIAIVVNSNQARTTDDFNYSLQQVLSIFHKSAVPNFIFVFTHGNKPNDALQTVNASLELIAKSAPEAKLIKNLNKKNNIFCFESNVFQNLVAKEKRENGVNFELDWKSNTGEFTKMIKYVNNLKSHDFFSTSKLHKIRSILSNVNLMLDDIKIQKQMARLPIDNSNSENKLELLEIEEKSYLHAAAKSFGYIKSNSLLHKNLKIIDYSKQLNNNYSFLDIERHLPIDHFCPAFYGEICDIMKKLILLKLSGEKFESIMRLESKSYNQKVNKNRDEIVQEKTCTVFKITE